MNDKPLAPITWDIGIPLVTNATMLASMAKVTLGAAALVAALVSLVLVTQGDGPLIPALLGYFLLGGVGFFAIALLIMLLLFGNRLRARFTVSAEGVRYETLDRMGRAGSRGALVLGLLAGRPGAAGSGLLALSQEQQTLRWTGAFRASADPARRTIALRNRWRTLLTVYCTAENYAAVRAFVTRQMAQHRTAERSAGRSPVGAYLLRTLLAVVACLPLFALGEVYGYGLFLPLLLLCFALATVWFVRHLAWVVLGTAAVLVVAMLAGALAVRGASFFGGQSYRRYEVLSGDAWALTALGGVGLVYLAWMAIATLRARIVPVLEADFRDSGEG